MSSKIACPDCERGVAMHELETKTIAGKTGFTTNYRCPFCRSDFEDIAESISAMNRA